MKKEEKLALATKLCDKRTFFFTKTDFNKIYPFTTENINAYIDEFDLEDKSLLTVGSSGDQAFNAALKGCKDITILDKSPFTREFFYLKKAALLSLDIEDFINLFSLKNKTNKATFNYDDIETVLSTLLDDDIEAYDFWNRLFDRRDLKTVREKLFLTDESNIPTLISSNNYLESESTYRNLQDKIEHIHPEFLIQDVREAKLDRQYDNIFLSNIFDYLKGREALYVLHSLLPHLNEEGRMLIYYLYSITLDDDIPTIEELYDPTQVLNYVPEEAILIPIESMEKRKIKQKDGVIIYQKNRR